MQNNNKYVCEFTVDEWNIIIGGLNEMPYKHSADVINGIHKQIGEQIKLETEAETALQNEQ